MDVPFGDDQMRLHTSHAVQNFTAINLTRLASAQRKDDLKTTQFIAETSNFYCVQTLGLT